MIRVSIPSYHKVIEDNNESYTAFIIEVCIVATGKTLSVQKRYSEFEMLHKQLKKQIKTPEFPPKKMMKFSNKVLEQRRLALQTYLQARSGLREVSAFDFVKFMHSLGLSVMNGTKDGVALADKIPKILLHFLDVEQYMYHGSQDSLDQLDVSNRTTHQSMIAFPPEAYLQDNRNGSWDIVSAGVLAALYNNVEDLVVR